MRKFMISNGAVLSTSVHGSVHRPPYNAHNIINSTIYVSYKQELLKGVSNMELPDVEV